MIGRRLSAASHTDFTDSNPTQQDRHRREKKSIYHWNFFWSNMKKIYLGNTMWQNYELLLTSKNGTYMLKFTMAFDTRWGNLKTFLKKY